MKLYEITELQKELEREEDAEIVSTLQEMVKMELENKAQNIVATIRNFDTDIDAIDAEITRLQELRKKVAKGSDKLKEYVLHNMQEMQLKEVKTAIGTLKISKSTRTEIDETKLPQICFDVVQTVKRKTIKEIEEMGITEGISKIDNYKLNLK